ncbi:MAG: isopeptide-forming domain-containing fimbrial protein [Lachnospiraceae bacterium]|jgi:fimbrial isopeptide formation D2 family protein
MKKKELFVQGLCAGICGMLIFSLPAATRADVPATFGSGSVTIENSADQSEGTSYRAFKVFDANVNSDGSLSNFKWPSTAVRSAVLSVIKSFDSTYTSTSPQDAADYICAAYSTDSGMSTDSETILDSDELLNVLASALDDLTGLASEDYKEFAAGVSVRLSEGYWLAVTASSSIDTDESGTSPVFLIIGDEEAVTINEKTSVPAVDKVLKNDADGADWTYGADAQIGQGIQHKVTGTLPSNLKTYDAYYYEFEDEMSVGISYETDSYAVTLDGKDVSSSFTQTLTSGAGGVQVLSIKCEDILAIGGVSPDADSVFELTYRVSLNPSCVIGSAGNPNDVRIRYSSNPNTNEIASTRKVRDYLYTFRLHMEKKDKDTNIPLAGAAFTILALAPDDTGSAGKYVQADGSLGISAFRFTTDSNGVIEVDGLDAGTYCLTEVSAPEGFGINSENTMLTVSAAYNDDGSIASLTNTVSGNADAAAGIDNILDTDEDGSVNNVVAGEEGTGAIAADGVVNVTIGNTKMILLPLSGKSGITMLMASGAGLAGISLLLGVLSSKKRKVPRRRRAVKKGGENEK